MRKLYLDFAFLGAWWLLAGCGSLPNRGDRCSDINPCKKNQGCQKDGTCVPVDAFLLSADALSDAFVGVPWGFELQAEGGIKPYAWYLETSLPWIEIDSRTGILSGTPDQSISKAEVTVTVVDDSYGAGQSATRTLLLTVSNCANGSVQTCFEASQGICYSGARQCIDAIWGSCTLVAASGSMEHCGPSCGLCASKTADRCGVGLCACGSNPVCQEGNSCCQGACTNQENDLYNCGVCSRDCSQLYQNVLNLQCIAGQCQYSACDDTHLDCDQDPGNGCETTISDENCSGCGINCSEGSSNHRCVLDALFGAYRCGCLDKDNCATGEQCCGNRCLPFNGAANCGGCHNNCGARTNRACIWDGSIDTYRCGCNDAADCMQGSQEQCCGMSCLALADDQHCGDCSTDCSGNSTRPHCVDSAQHTCGCVDSSDCGGNCCWQNGCLSSNICP